MKCPQGYVYVKSYFNNGKKVKSHCRKAITKSQLSRETIEAIPFGYDAVVLSDYFKYGRQHMKKKKL